MSARRWRFFLQELANGHWVSVARGPPENIVDAWREFTGTLEAPVIPIPEFQARALPPCLPPSLDRACHGTRSPPMRVVAGRRISPRWLNDVLLFISLTPPAWLQVLSTWPGVSA